MSQLSAHIESIRVHLAIGGETYDMLTAIIGKDLDNILASELLNQLEIARSGVLNGRSH